MEGSYKDATETSRAAKGRETLEQLLEMELNDSQSRATAKCGHESRGLGYKNDCAGEGQQQSTPPTDRRSSFLPTTLLYGLSQLEAILVPPQFLNLQRK
jgi:hypothetical protein